MHRQDRYRGRWPIRLIRINEQVLGRAPKGLGNQIEILDGQIAIRIARALNGAKPDAGSFGHFPERVAAWIGCHQPDQVAADDLRNSHLRIVANAQINVWVLR